MSNVPELKRDPLFIEHELGIEPVKHEEDMGMHVSLDLKSTIKVRGMLWFHT